jgi:hypothetical protein
MVLKSKVQNRYKNYNNYDNHSIPTIEEKANGTRIEENKTHLSTQNMNKKCLTQI